MRIFSARYLLPIATNLLEDAALLVDGSRILADGRRRDIVAAHAEAERVDCGEAVILPPLANAHTHLELTDFPVWSAAAGESDEPGDFADWILRLVRVRRSVDDAAVRASLASGLRQSLLAGTGAIGDILSTLPAAGAYAGTPLLGRVFAEVLGVEDDRVALRLQEISGLLAVLPAAGLAWGLSPHAPYTLSRQTFNRAMTFAHRQNLPLAMHWAETVEEMAFVRGGEGALRKLYAAAGWAQPTELPSPVDYRGLVVHGAHLDPAGVDALAATGQSVVLCPRSNSRFGDARAPLAALRRAGVPLALGTDSRASCPSLSVWDELAFARSWFAGAIDPSAWLETATHGGSRALGLADRSGRLTAGMDASFQVVAIPEGASEATLEEALCGVGANVAVRALYLRGENVLPP